MVEHTEKLEFPNGLGYTPCSREYKEIAIQVRLLNDIAHNEDGRGLTNDEYNLVNELENRMGVMQLNGHLGRSVRY